MAELEAARQSAQNNITYKPEPTLKEVMRGVTVEELRANGHWYYIHQTDVWRHIEKGSGECEEYAIHALAYLLKRGWPRHSLFLAGVYDKEREQNHVVLIVRLGDKEFIIDNLTPKVLPWQDLRHKFLFMSREAEGDPTKWVKFAGRKQQQK